MTDDEKMAYQFHWNVSREAFRDQVRGLIHQAYKRGKVIPLPIPLADGDHGLDLMTLLLSQVKCEGCDAPCCRRNPEGKPTELVAPEYRRLSEKYGKEHFVMKGAAAYLPMPCPFREWGPAGFCRIYPDRPLVCTLFPFQFGANDGSGRKVLALASSCPESRRIARGIYMTAWQLRQHFFSPDMLRFIKGTPQPDDDKEGNIIDMAKDKG